MTRLYCCLMLQFFDQKLWRDAVIVSWFVTCRNICQMPEEGPSRQPLMMLLEEMYKLQPRIGYQFLYFLKVRYECDLVIAFTCLLLALHMYHIAISYHLHCSDLLFDQPASHFIIWSFCCQIISVICRMLGKRYQAVFHLKICHIGSNIITRLNVDPEFGINFFLCCMTWQLPLPISEADLVAVGIVMFQ